MTSNRSRRIAKELADIHKDAHSQITVESIGGGDDLTHLKGSFPGPPGTPYEGGTFRIDIKIPTEYPFRPPVMRFDTKLWHPNVSSQTVSHAVKLIYDYVLGERLTRICIGCDLPRYARYGLVTGPYDQVCVAFSTIPAQHARAQRPSRRGSRQHVGPESERVRACGTGLVGYARGSPQKTHWGKQWGRDDQVSP